MLLNSADQADPIEGRQLIEETLHNGTALACFEKMLVQQNVDRQLAADLCSGNKVLDTAKHVTPILASNSGITLSNTTTPPSSGANHM